MWISGEILLIFSTTQIQPQAFQTSHHFMTLLHKIGLEFEKFLKAEILKLTL